MRLLLAGLQAAHVASLLPAWLRFQRGAGDPRVFQEERLRAILSQNADTAYGRAHDFGNLGSVEAFQRRVPLTTYEDLAPWIDRVGRGEAQVLTRETVKAFERTSGSSGTDKLIPYTRGLLAEFAAATEAWIFDLHRRLPGLWGTKAYWSVSPVTRQAEQTAGGIPVGLEDDTEYFSPMTRWALRRVLAVPPELARADSMDTWRSSTLRHLLSARDLGLISVWSPTFLTLLMQALEQDLDTLLDTQTRSRQQEIQRSLERSGRLDGEAIWPRLTLISCWTDGASAGFVQALLRWFPRVTIQGKGLLATEGVVSIPFGSEPGGVLASNSHFLEFLDPDDPERPPALAPALEVGGRYSPVITTSGGLYRYHLKDVVQCVGHYRQAPRIQFVSRLDRISDLVGEKLSVRQVRRALQQAADLAGFEPRFALVAPVQPVEPHEPPYYCLYLESDAAQEALRRFAHAVERQLAQAHHYRYCRDLGQLDALHLQPVRDGATTYTRVLCDQGQRAGDIKPCSLDARTCWADAFGAGEAVP